MPVAPQSTESATSLTGRFVVRNLMLHILPQGAHLGGPVVVDGGRAFLPGSRLCPHLEHLDPVAGAAGEN